MIDVFEVFNNIILIKNTFMYTLIKIWEIRFIILRNAHYKNI